MQPPVLTDACATALLTFANAVLADAPPGAALPTVVTLSSVLTDGRAAALLTLGAPPAVFAEHRATTTPALAAHPAVLAEAVAAALYASVTMLPVLADG